MRRWYWIALIVWCLTGLPILLLAIGFGGGHLSWPTSDTALPWATAGLIILSPVILFPFARNPD